MHNRLTRRRQISAGIPSRVHSWRQSALWKRLQRLVRLQFALFNHDLRACPCVGHEDFAWLRHGANRHCESIALSRQRHNISAVLRSVSSTLRSMKMFWLRFDSSTNESGQISFRSSSFVTTSRLRRTSASSVSNAFGVNQQLHLLQPARNLR
jgi:hypothetical protein